MQYRVKYYSPTRWVFDPAIEVVDTLEEAKNAVRKFLENFPPSQLSDSIVIEEFNTILKFNANEDFNEKLNSSN